MKKWLAGVCILASLSGGVFAQEMSVSKVPDNISYFDITLQNAGLLDGTYEGWCTNWGRLIEHDVLYNAIIYYPYSPMPDGVVDKPEHLDEMNWVLNKHFVGKTSYGGFGVYTTGDVQLAIWTLVDDHFDDSTVGPYSQDRVNEIVERALLYGADFYPNCNQVVGILVEPSNRDTGAPVQGTVVEVPRKKFRKCIIPENEL